MPCIRVGGPASNMPIGWGREAVQWLPGGLWARREPCGRTATPLSHLGATGLETCARCLSLCGQAVLVSCPVSRSSLPQASIRVMLKTQHACIHKMTQSKSALQRHRHHIETLARGAKHERDYVLKTAGAGLDPLLHLGATDLKNFGRCLSLCGQAVPVSCPVSRSSLPQASRYRARRPTC